MWKFIQIPFIVENTRVKNLMHLREAKREFDISEFVEGPIIQGFSLEGIFVAHSNFVGYRNLSKIFVPQEIEGNIFPETVINTNVKKLKHNNPKTKQRPKGESPSQAISQPN